MLSQFTEYQLKNIVHQVYGARLSKLRPYKHGRGWFSCGPLVLYDVAVYDNNGQLYWHISRFTPDRQGVFRQYECWFEGAHHCHKRPRGSRRYPKTIIVCKGE